MLAEAWVGVVRAVGATAKAWVGVVTGVGATARAWVGVVRGFGATARAWIGVVRSFGATARAWVGVVRAFGATARAWVVQGFGRRCPRQESPCSNCKLHNRRCNIRLCDCSHRRGDLIKKLTFQSVRERKNGLSGTDKRLEALCLKSLQSCLVTAINVKRSFSEPVCRGSVASWVAFSPLLPKEKRFMRNSAWVLVFLCKHLYHSICTTGPAPVVCRLSATSMVLKRLSDWR